MVTVASDQQAFAALAGVKVADEGLLSDAVGAAPAGVTIKPAILLGLRRAEVSPHIFAWNRVSHLAFT